MKIFHISDMHISTRWNINYKKLIRILEYISLQKPDHIVITGDLSANGKFSELNLVKNLLIKFNLYHTELVSVVPGNHDIYPCRGNFPDLDKIMYPFYNPDTAYHTSKFYSCFNDLIPEQTSYLSKNIYIKELNNKTVLVGLNSIAPLSYSNKLGYIGEINSKQLSFFSSKYFNDISRNKYVIVAMHHFFCDRKITNKTYTFWDKIEYENVRLKNDEESVQKFNKHSINLLLHGHLHESTSYNILNILFSNAGGSVGKHSNNYLINKINIDNTNTDFSIIKKTI